ncbi:MAG: DUF4407 domain-containing protein [Bacteroidetes bacterium]|nr:DUF4407 domain-containing protein [Bacteroidota bacterium]
MNEINDYLKNYDMNNPNSGRFKHKVTRFLWWCAGADKQILEKCPLGDRVRYAGIGGIVLATGVLAAVSGGYAFYTIFGPKGDAVVEEIATIRDLSISAIFAILWGLIVFNMDRFIVSSTGKGDGKDTISWKELGQALPRIIIAVILAFAISSPLETRILKSEIDAKLQTKQDEYLLELNKNTDKIKNEEINRVKTEISKMEKEILGIEESFEKRRLEIKEARIRLEDEIAGRIGSGKAGEGPAARTQKENLTRQEQELNEQKKNKEPEIAAKKTRLKASVLELDKIYKSIEEDKAKNKLKANNLDGLLERIHISHEIGGIVPWIIFLVLLSIEAGPIFFKMMMQKGVYEYLVENNKKRFLSLNGIVVEEKLVEDKHDVKHAEITHFMEAEKEINAKKEQLDKESDLTSHTLDKWHKSKKGEIDENPEQFFNEH